MWSNKNFPPDLKLHGSWDSDNRSVSLPRGFEPVVWSPQKAICQGTLLCVSEISVGNRSLPKVSPGGLACRNVRRGEGDCAPKPTIIRRDVTPLCDQRQFRRKSNSQVLPSKKKKKTWKKLCKRQLCWDFLPLFIHYPGARVLVRAPGWPLLWSPILALSGNFDLPTFQDEPGKGVRTVSHAFILSIVMISREFFFFFSPEVWSN